VRFAPDEDVGKARKFFASVFGWRFERFPRPYRIQAGATEEAGIDGGIGAAKDTPTSGGNPLTQVTIPVADLNEVISKVRKAGGEAVEPKMPIPGIGRYTT
jgi:predicted enzyme related to lactoylglutathione lyase